MTYDELLIYADDEGLIVKEKVLDSYDGRIFKNKIAIRKDIPTLKEKCCVLAEELGHHFTTVGNILNINDEMNYKQELKARIWGYNKKIGLVGIINAFEAHCTDQYETAEYLDVTESYLQEAIDAYKSKYGIYTKVDNYILYFEPCLGVMKLF